MKIQDSAEDYKYYVRPPLFHNIGFYKLQATNAIIVQSVIIRLINTCSIL